MSCCGDGRPATPAQHLVTGAMLVFTGGVLLAYGRGWIEIANPGAWWPLGFVAIGIHRLVAHPAERSLLAAAIWSGVGAAIIAANLGYVTIRARDIVPVVLVVLGVAMLLGRSRREGTS